MGNCIYAESPRKFTVNLFAYSAGDSARTTVNPVRGLLCPLSLPHELNLRIYVYLVRGLNGKLYIAESPRIFTVILFAYSAGDSARTTVNPVRGLLCPLSLPHEMNLWIYVNLARGLNGKLYIAESPRKFTVILFNVSAGDSAQTTVNTARGHNGKFYMR